MDTCEKCERVPTRIDGVCPVYNMSDGRQFTDYNSRCVQNNAIAKDSKAMNSYDYRMYLQKNAKKLIESNKEIANNNNNCVPCYDLNSDGTMLPEENKFQCDTNTCNMYVNNINGIGTGRDYTVVGENRTIQDNGNNSGETTETFLNLKR
jgi:hypothetical protein